MLYHKDYDEAMLASIQAPVLIATANSNLIEPILQPGCSLNKLQTTLIKLSWNAKTMQNNAPSTSPSMRGSFGIPIPGLKVYN